MSTSATTLTAPKSGAPPLAPAAFAPTRLVYWSVRRELWENRSVYIAPFATAALLIFLMLALLLSFANHGIGAQPVGAKVGVGHIDSTTSAWLIYFLFGAPVIAISLLVAVAYCLSALHAERQDRSILFWKSMPVSDLITVLSKATIPIFLVPLIAFVAAVIAQLAILAVTLAAVVLFGAGSHIEWGGVPIGSPGAVNMILSTIPVGYVTLGMLYGLLATALWHAPLYAWLLLVGGWARRMAFVWAVVPAGALVLVEQLVFGTDHLATLLSDRLYGSLSLAFSSATPDKLPDLTPGRFFGSPGVWIGLAVAGLFLGVAVLLRRNRQPI